MGRDRKEKIRSFYDSIKIDKLMDAIIICDKAPRIILVFMAGYID